MSNTHKLLPLDIDLCSKMSCDELSYIKSIFSTYNGFPSLKELWGLMDDVWISTGCNKSLDDEKLSSYYNHPVWMLNGLYGEQDKESMRYRQLVANWICNRKPLRVADLGGGFGTLAREIAHLLPDTQIEVVEPHPSNLALNLASEFKNLLYVENMSEQYDLIIALDVMEHVIDPLYLAHETALFLKQDGTYLFGNCFLPVVKCHLPENYHLYFGWSQVMKAMGLRLSSCFSYYEAYQTSPCLDLGAAREVETLSRHVYSLIKFIPYGKRTLGKAFLSLSLVFQGFDIRIHKSSIH